VIHGRVPVLSRPGVSGFRRALDRVIPRARRPVRHPQVPGSGAVRTALSARWACPEPDGVGRLLGRAPGVEPDTSLVAAHRVGRAASSQAIAGAEARNVPRLDCVSSVSFGHRLRREAVVGARKGSEWSGGERGRGRCRRTRPVPAGRGLPGGAPGPCTSPRTAGPPRADTCFSTDVIPSYSVLHRASSCRSHPGVIKGG